MKNLRFIVYVAGLIWLLFQFPAYAAPAKISILGQRADATTLRNIVNTRILNAPRYRNQQISEVDVKVATFGGQKHLVSTLKYKNIYYFETAVVTLASDNKFQKMEINVTPQRALQLLRAPAIAAISACPDNSIDMVFATPEDGIPTAVTGANAACNSARAGGYRCRTLIGDQATVKAYKSYLTNCPKLKALGNIGHGNTGGILLADGVLDAAWFNSLATNKLKNIVSYFNSCQVHNPQLEPAMMHAGSRSYIGGNVNLGIGTSEEVFKCFWNDALVNNKAMKPALTSCEINKYPTTGAHGFSGYQGNFKTLIMSPIKDLKMMEIKKPIPELQPIPIPKPRPVLPAAPR